MQRGPWARAVAATERAVAALAGRTGDSGAPAPLVDDPLEALSECQGGRPTAFRCPVELCTHFTGHAFDPAGWHPFVAALLEVRGGFQGGFEGSVLHAYYTVWQPANAAEAYAGFGGAPPALRALPPACFYLTPWTAWTADEVMSDLRSWTAAENAEHGEPGLDVDRHGLGYFGPVDPRKGRLEYRRLVDIYERLAERGYDRAHGDVVVRLFRRGSDLRFVIDGGGYHRTAAAAAAGLSTVPARFREPFAIGVDDAASWPQVRRGVWTRDAAERYFHHLFDFDARGWARDRSLLPNQRPSRGAEPS